MADITPMSEDVSIVDNTTGAFAGVVSATNRLKVDALITGGGAGDGAKNYWQLASETKGYIVHTGIVTIAPSTEQDFMLIKNPSGSGKLLRIKWICPISIEGQDHKGFIYRLYRSPTITANGTALTINPLKTSTGASVMEAYRQPTISARGTLVDAKVWNDSEIQIVDYDLTFYIAAGENVLVSNRSAVTNRETGFTMHWLEE